MYKRDYLLRLIQQYSEEMVKVMFHRRNQQFAEAMELLVQAMQRLLGLNSKLVQGLAVKDLIGLLSVQGRLDAGKGLLLADMLKAQGDTQMDAGQETNGRNSCMKSLELLLEMRLLEETEDIKDTVDSRINVLLEKVHPHNNRHVLELLLGFYEAEGKLAKAEDTLFFMLEADSGKPTLIDQGLAMYERWRNLTLEQVEHGNLTMPEIEESYELLKKMKQNGS